MAKALLRRQRHCGGFGIFDLVNNPIFQFALSVFIAFWTARAAVARGRSPWLWGGVALIFGLLSIEDSLRGLSFASVAPVLYLMLFVRPKERRPMRPQRNACPKCAAPHSPQQNYCTKCGWELSREYAPENNDTVLASEMRQPSTPPERDTATATMERPAETPSEAAPPATATPAEPASAPEPAAAQRPADAAAEPTPQPSAPDAEPEPEPRPWGIPQPGPAPTAEQMTARGAMLLGEGRIQEAIDQFTKAIALDPKHREAFEGRAEAYTQQGRGERAAEDYRRIQALNAGS